MVHTVMLLSTTLLVSIIMSSFHHYFVHINSFNARIPDVFQYKLFSTVNHSSEIAYTHHHHSFVYQSFSFIFDQFVFDIDPQHTAHPYYNYIPIYKLSDSL